MTPSTERPRVEGDREQEILDATLEVLAEVGYDRLTMDAVAAKAQGVARPRSTAAGPTRSAWSSRRLQHTKGPARRRPTPARCAATSQQVFCGIGGLTDPTRGRHVRQRAHRDRPRPRVRRGVPPRRHRPQDRRLPADLRAGPAPAASSATTSTSTCSSPALAGIVLHRVFVLGEPPDADDRSPG